LDVGCGVGYGSWIIKNQGAAEVLGVDISEEALNYAKKNYAAEGVSFNIGDCENLENYPEQFDIIVAFEFIEHIKYQKKFIESTKSNLRNDGIFFVSSPNKNTYQNQNPFHINELTPGSFKRMLKPYFKNVVLLDQRFLFTNYIIPPHNKKENGLKKINDPYAEEKIRVILPFNLLKDSRYIVAVCSDRDIDLKEAYCSISTYEVDSFSLVKGMEGLYKDWAEKIQISTEEKRILDHIRNSKFYKLWQFYNKIKKKVIVG
jgi:SAM-dependent methyltransferase